MFFTSKRTACPVELFELIAQTTLTIWFYFGLTDHRTQTRRSFIELVTSASGVFLNLSPLIPINGNTIFYRTSPGIR